MSLELRSPHRVTEERADRDELLRFVAGLSALLAGVTHLVVTPHHLQESFALGVCFLLLGLAQVALGVALRWRLPDGLLVLTLGLHVVAVVAYVLSRTRDLPILPPHDDAHEIDHLPVAGGVGDGVPVFPGSRIESVGLVDLVCVLAELSLIWCLVALLPERARRLTTWAAAAVAAALVVSRFLGILS